MRKPAFYECENKGTDQLRGNRAVTAQLISIFVLLHNYVAKAPKLLNTKF